MPQIIVLPHHEICPDGAAVEASSGESVCEVLLANDIDIEHACEMSCACHSFLVSLEFLDMET
jgi:2Fe-2S ferredoxin